MREGYLALVLHAHLPYVRHPEYEDSLEENWLYEAITETYIPLFLVLEDLVADGIDFRLTFSLTPTLASMLLDPFLGSRYLRKLDRLIELAEKEIARTRSEPAFQPLARMYHKLFLEVREAFVNRYGRNLVEPFKRFQQLGKIEVMATAATHGYLPLLSVTESAVRTQIRVGVEHYRQIFGCSPRGFWLPECGYYPGVDALLAEHDIRFTILESHGITRATVRPTCGVYAPIRCPSGVAAFGRDPESSQQVWSSVTGYPGDYDYREFYRDVGHDLDLEYIRPYIHPDGIRIDTGVKYYRITGKGDYKEPYVPEWADRKAETHAGHFLSERSRQIEQIGPMMDSRPIVVAPYDAELFGHWWFEGPKWLNHLIRKVAATPIQLTTLSEYLDECGVHQVAVPAFSSWGHRGFSEVWLNGQNDWIYRHLHWAGQTMEKLGRSHRLATGLSLRALNQAARELLLAQASDWAFMINSGTMHEYAARRTRSHLLRMQRLRDQVESGTIDEAWLARIENQDNIFPQIATAADFLEAAAAPPLESRVEAQPAALHIAMICPEIAPFAKTGGLADMAGALALTLERLGHKVSLIMPAYRSVLRGPFSLEDTGIQISAPVSGRQEQGRLLKTTLGREIAVYLVRADQYFDRDQLYGAAAGDYCDNAERFVFFSRAALELLRRMERPQIIHAHDWQTALVLAFLRAQPERYPELPAVRTVLTVHNAGYQGLFWKLDWHLLDLDSSLFTPRHLEFHDRINFLKGGLVYADAITTVSPSYAQELKTSEQGFGLEGLFEERAADLFGILNGADYAVWNPATDPFIAARYSAGDLSGKELSKADLQREFGLAQAPEIPLLGMVSRLATQKGFDLLEEALDELLERDLQFVLLGAGDRRYEEFLTASAERHGGRLGVRIGFDEALAHKVEAGADMFLMPSRYEPSGLNQLYSLKYGTIPIVRATGGLKDSVEEGTGFLFGAYTRAALLEAVDRALALFGRKDDWAVLMANAMQADHSWDRSAQEYIALYRRILTCPVRRP